MKFARISNKLLLLVLLFSLSACTSAAVLSGAGFGINYTFDNIAYKTLNYSLDDVEGATTDALEALDINIMEESGDYPQKQIKAATMELNINIKLEKVTSRATRIKVNAKKGVVVKDKATAAAIIRQVEKELEG